MFTKREIEIICLIARGMRSQIVRERLYVSHEIIKTHPKNILRKIRETEKEISLPEFVIHCGPLAETLAKLPKSYLSASAMPTIGISISGQHSASREQPGLVSGGCSTSGGTGTVFCSNACCSISCSTGYYATAPTLAPVLKNKTSNFTFSFV
ncbi:LuxR C-terminal-related transcriptional regulator [Dyadobacter pollutisoli]|uniref:Helix-turn-helix transcriptional regulator n=1 Tax=Dyadobacter pollutisoli TaxID=2910158 RepID=A0A9E8NGR3_9BACT|nr:helix-turn-helix transcriptional regulator [Dyadobacter pollutisoli]WAC14291.1 helix-turn-helix transcriptional regulator [Dyadobacter pollutisoli]